MISFQKNNEIEPLEFASFACYSPRGTSQIEEESRKIKDAIKNVKPIVVRSLFQEKYIDCFRTNLSSFFNETTILVPTPRSSLRLEGAIWPSWEICKAFLNNGLGRDILICLERTEPIKKSSLNYSTNDRPLVTEQIKTLGVSHQIVETNSITIIDDVITTGRTTFACALKLRSYYPDKEIRAFSVIRTMSSTTVTKIVEPCIGKIIYYPSGKTFRKDDAVFNV